MSRLFLSRNIEDGNGRAGCARLCYHSPALGLLDESTSSMSVEAEARVYQPCVIIATSRTLG